MTVKTIYVTGYPKSGNTWLTRLLGSILNSPTGGCMPKEDKNEIATEGQDRTGDYVIRKGHFTFATGGDCLVPSPHKMNLKYLTDEKIVFIVRDPRDICVSGAYHWNTNPEDFLGRMIRGTVANVGRWDEYCKMWLNFPRARYEFLSIAPFTECVSVLVGLQIDYDVNDINQAIQYQSFESISKRTPKGEHKRNNLRKGIVGDWRNHFTPKMNDRIWNEFGDMMERLGYEYH